MKRRAGSFREPTDFRPGDHICWTYSSDDEHRKVLTAFVAEGLQAGQRIAYFAPRGEEQRLADYLRACHVAADALLADGRLVLGRAEEGYAPNGTLDVDLSLKGFRAMAEQAVADGFAGLRVTGENGWILANPSLQELWPAYEVRVDRMIAGLPLIGMCDFDIRECGEQAMRLMEAVHPMRLGAGSGSSVFHLHSSPDAGVVLQGELDVSSSGTVGSLLQALADDGVTRGIDLSGLSFADVHGIRAIAGAARSMARRAGTVRIEDPPKSFSRVWQLLRLDQALPVELASSGRP